MNRLGNRDGIFVADAEHLDEGARLSVEVRLAVVFLEAIVDRRHLAKPQSRSVRARPQHDLLEIDHPLGLALGSQQDFAAALGLDRAARQVDGRTPYRSRHLVERHAVLP